MGPVSGNLWRTAHPRASVLVVHGLGEHGGRYAAFASEVAEWGFTTAAVDWPGHGRSPGPRGNASWCAMRDEIIPAALDALATEVSVPRLLVGHSMGGAMALDVALATMIRLHEDASDTEGCTRFSDPRVAARVWTDAERPADGPHHRPGVFRA
jgi:alpha-beta hydrolase superfamily lysophospholipase